MHRWLHHFRSETEVAERFIGNLQRLKAIAEDLGPRHGQALILLQKAESLYRDWSRNPARNFTNIFLAPAIDAARAVAHELEKAGHYEDAFSISNTFGEMAKILVERLRERFIQHFEDLLLTACCAAGGLWLKEKPPQIGEDQNEIAALRVRMQSICGDALGTFFSKRDLRFYPTKRPETALGEWAINEALARYFDKQLRHLLEVDRPRVKDFVRVNMPIVYRMSLHGDAAGRRRTEWERLLINAGYDDVLRLLKDMGDLINPDEVGVINPERRNDVIRASANNDLERVAELLGDSAKELKVFLYSEAQLKLRYREPTTPDLSDWGLKNKFAKAQVLSKTDDPDNLRKSLAIAQTVWQAEINNLDLRDWVAYLQAKTGNLQAADQMFDYLRKRRSGAHCFATDWNLAVLAYDRKNEKEAYQLLLPLVAEQSFDQDLVLVLLALALKLDDSKTFLSIIPQLMSLRFHPLAIVVAQKSGDIVRVSDLIGQLLRQWQGKWELPPVTDHFSSQDFEKAVNRAIVEGQLEQLITWLRARIKVNRAWVPNHLALARVLEGESQDFDGAFSALRDVYDLASKRRPRDQTILDRACRDLLEFCKRCHRNDLGQQAYRLASQVQASADLLRSFRSFGPQSPPPPNEHEQKVIPRVEPAPNITTRDPQLPERLAWVTARLAGIRNVATYVEQSEAIEQFLKIVAEINPRESATALDLIRSTTAVFETFARSDPNDHDARRSLYDRASGFEKRLTQLVRSEAVSQHLADVLTPYCKVLQQVIGDLSRRAGVGPIVEASIENEFVSLEGDRTTLVLRVINKTERPVTDVFVDLLIEGHQMAVVGKREWIIGKLDAQENRVLSIPIERKRAAENGDADKVVFGISLRASAEGFPNVDLGIIKKHLPIGILSDFVGAPEIPKIFEIGDPLKRSEPTLFQGRSEMLNKIRSSFYGGIQRERYFLDGIRRAGKTSMLNFLPDYLPETVVPIRINLEDLDLRGPIDSARVLWRFCKLINSSLSGYEHGGISIPDEAAFIATPGGVFNSFLKNCRTALPGHVPLLMFDEFQQLLHAIAVSGSAKDRDSLVLDVLRANLEEGTLYAVFTGSVRFDRLSEILDHRIYGSLTRLRVSFLSEESVGSVLRAGMQQWAKLLPETIKKVHYLSGGYPWLVQKYGAGLVDLLNEEHRTVATPDDVEFVTEDAVLCNKELFSFWWPTDQLGSEEEHFIEWLFRRHLSMDVIATRDFFADISNRDQPAFRRAFDNLRACEVLDSTQTQYVRFRGAVLRRWLEQQIQDGQLRMRRNTELREEQRGYSGIFIDHENMIKSLERIGSARGLQAPRDKVEWFNGILTHLLEEAERRIGELKFKVAAAFWSRPEEASLSTAYHRYDFDLKQPEDIKVENAVDFKLADEVRRKREQAMREGSRLSRAILLCGDGDLSHASRALVNDGVSIQIWGGSRSTSDSYAEIVGKENIVVLDDVCGL